MASEGLAKVRIFQELSKGFSNVLAYGFRRGANVLDNFGPSIDQSDDILQVVAAVVIAFAPVLESLKLHRNKQRWTDYFCRAVLAEISSLRQFEGLGEPL